MGEHFMPKINPITISQMDRLGVDEENRLYWDSKPLVIEEKLTLSRWVNISVILGAISTAAMAVIQIYQLFCHP